MERSTSRESKCHVLAFSLALLSALISIPAFAIDPLPAPNLHAVEKADSSSQALLRWSKVEGATRYHVLVVAYRYLKNVSTPIESTWVDDSTVTDTSRLVSDLASSQYKWSVCAGTAEGWGTFASASTFGVYRATAPAPLTDAVIPQLLSPYDGERVRSTTVELTWSLTVPGGDRFQYRLRRISPVAETVSEVVVKSSKITLAGLIPGSEYAWEIRAGDSSRWAPFSPTRQFQIVESVNPELIYPRPEEIVPADGPIRASGLQFRWYSGALAIRYMFKLHRLAPGDSVLAVVYVPDTNYTMSLPPNAEAVDYEWYVCSVQAGSGGGCSPTQRFRTQSSASAPDSQALLAARRLDWEQLGPGNQWTYRYLYRRSYFDPSSPASNGGFDVLHKEESKVTAEIRNRSVSGDSIFFQVGVNVRALDRQYETMQEEKFLLTGPVENRSLFSWNGEGNRWEVPLYYGNSDGQYPVADLLFRPPEWGFAKALEWVRWGTRAPDLRLRTDWICAPDCDNAHAGSQIRGIGLMHWIRKYYSGGSLGTTYESEYILTSVNGVPFDSNDVITVLPPVSVAPKFRSAPALLPPGNGNLQARLDAIPDWTSAYLVNLAGAKLAEWRKGDAISAVAPKGLTVLRINAKSGNRSLLLMNP